MKRFQKVYLEISNLCNLTCSFCPGTKRQKKAMTVEEFSSLLPKLIPFSDYLYFHVMGEPLLHPELSTFLSLAGDAGFKVILTTNGTLLKQQQEMLLSSPALHKVNISLHAFEANSFALSFTDYLEQCFLFGKSAEGKKLVVYRLWNQGGLETRNQEILDTMKCFFPKPWKEGRRGIQIGEKVFLEYGQKFDWPDLEASDEGSHVFCYGLRDQIGILCDGTVIPCCLDHEGDIALGNLFEESIEEILDKPRTKAIIDGFCKRHATEELCRKCGFARRF